jgi:chemotaxis methyl-accepting protein methylase
MPFSEEDFVPKATAISPARLRAFGARFARRWIARPYLLINEWIWSGFAARRASWRVVRAYGNHLHHLNQRWAARRQSCTTYFFRNRPQLELMCRLLGQWPQHATVRIAVIGCSKGAEVYSISYAIRRAYPDLRLRMTAVDVSSEVLDTARAGVYALSGFDAPDGEHRPTWVSDKELAETLKDQPSSIFERMSEAEKAGMFVRNKRSVSVKSEFRHGITWVVADAMDPLLPSRLGRYDIVVANDFLCHMDPPSAKDCLRNVAGLVAPGGYIFVSGVDLAVRSTVAHELAWIPVPDAIRETHEGDPSLQEGWPLNYWGLEPFNRTQRDWTIRYASVFRCDRHQDGLGRFRSKAASRKELQPTS